MTNQAIRYLLFSCNNNLLAATFDGSLIRISKQNNLNDNKWHKDIVYNHHSTLTVIK